MAKLHVTVSFSSKGNIHVEALLKGNRKKKRERDSHYFLQRVKSSENVFGWEVEAGSVETCW